MLSHLNGTNCILRKYGLIEPLTGEYGVIDDLFLAYEGNQAVRVEDYGEDPVFDGAGGVERGAVFGRF